LRRRVINGKLPPGSPPVKLRPAGLFQLLLFSHTRLETVGNSQGPGNSISPNLPFSSGVCNFVLTLYDYYHPIFMARLLSIQLRLFFIISTLDKTRCFTCCSTMVEEMNEEDMNEQAPDLTLSSFIIYIPDQPGL
jgi:hypothetical protein